MTGMMRETAAVGFRVLNAVVNPVVKAALRSPLHRILSSSLVVLSYSGRRSGQRHSLPVQYARDGEAFVVVAAWPDKKRFSRNLRGGGPVTVVHRGRRLRGLGRVVKEPAEAQRLRSIHRSRFPKGRAHDAVVVRIDLKPPEEEP